MKAVIFENQVMVFNSHWPGSPIQLRNHLVEFDKDGNLVDSDFYPCEDGPAALALIAQIQRHLGL